MITTDLVLLRLREFALLDAAAHQADAAMASLEGSDGAFLPEHVRAYLLGLVGERANTIGADRQRLVDYFAGLAVAASSGDVLRLDAATGPRASADDSDLPAPRLRPAVVTYDDLDIGGV